MNRLNSLNIGTLTQLLYTRDNVGNITSILDNLDSVRTKTYIYDSLYRLTQADGLWGSLNYNYDPVGNRQAETTDTGITNYLYNANRLASTIGEKTFNFSFDANGNTSTENTKQYIYNQNQRLLRVTDTVVLGEYVYNGNGQRVKKIAGGTTTIFQYAIGSSLIAESDNTGIITSEYVYLYGQPLAKIENDNVYFYHNNHLATPMLMTDESGSTVWEGEYLPFGEKMSVTGFITNNLRFPGQYFDSETGLHYNYYRDYKPEVGRYIEADPIGIQKANNHLFVYVGNNPVNWVDPTGLLKPPLPPDHSYIKCRKKLRDCSKELKDCLDDCSGIPEACNYEKGSESLVGLCKLTCYGDYVACRIWNVLWGAHCEIYSPI